MLSLITRIFGKESKPEEEPQRIPAKGEIWGLQSGPWPPTHTVLIADVRDGWVRYNFSTHGGESRMEVDRFIRAYYPTAFQLETN